MAGPSTLAGLLAATVLIAMPGSMNAGAPGGGGHDGGASTAPAATGYADYPAAVRAAGAAWDVGDFTRALAAMDAALALRPGHPRARYNRALILARLGRRNEALSQLESVAAAGIRFPLPADVFAPLADEPRFRAVKERFEANGRRRGRADVAASLADPDFVPEGIAWDGRGFLLGSIRSGRLVRLVPGGGAETVLEPAADAARGPWSIYGILLDGGDLWMATNADRHYSGYDGAHRAALLRVHAGSGEVRAQYVFPDAGAKGTILGDLAMAGGALYVSDATGGGVYRIEDGAFQALVPAGAMRSPQGMAAGADGRHLFVADYSRGLFSVRLSDGATKRLESPDGQTLFGIDGLIRDGRRLIAVQNGFDPHRILEIGLDRTGAAVTGVRVLAASLDAFDEPTLGTMADGRFCFVANSHWNRFDPDGNLPGADELSGPTVLCLAD